MTKSLVNLVYDESMTKFLILHGTDASPESNWFMWLKGVLIGKGHQVWLPQLPNSDTPDSKAYTKFLLSNDKFIIDEDTIIIGHSSGAVEIFNLLQNLPNEAVIKAAILVSAFKDDLGWDSLSGLFQEPIDFEKVKTKSKRFIFIHSDNDPYIPIEQAKYLQEQVSGDLVVFEDQGHFNLETGPEYNHFPELIDIIDKVI